MLTSKILIRFFYYFLRWNAFRQKVARYCFDKKISQDEKILNLVSNPPEKKSTSIYCRYFLTRAMIKEGGVFWNTHKETLKKVESLYGVPASIIVALLGIESYYGKNMGTHLVFNTLSTLAFSNLSRKGYFQQELKNYLLFTKKFKLDPYTIKGSYMGAMGICQFMPHAYLNCAVSYTGSHCIDLFNNPADAIISTASFLKERGWEPKQPILLSANVPDKAKGIAKKFRERTTAPHLTLQELRQKGVFPNNYDESKLSPELKADLIYFDAAPINHWLGFNNFYVLTRYNASYNYAMAVFRLSKYLEGEIELCN